MNHTAPNVTEDDIADYLLATPDFFIRHAELLARIELTHPHSGRAISLADRQIELQRERYKALETKHMQLFHLGKENVGLAGKLHQWMLGLLAIRTVDSSISFSQVQAIRHVCNTLESIFDVPEAAVDTSKAAMVLASQMLAPTCGLAAEAFFQNANVGAALKNAAAVNSLAVIPMPSVGLLVLASHDANRFTADMGTEFLTRLGQLAHAALS